MSIVTFTNTGRILKPYAPCHLAGGRDASGNVTLQWVRRTRVNGTWLNGVDVPLGEATEQYQVIVYTDNTYTTAVLTYTPIVQTQAISAADQTTGFGSPQSTLYCSVAQLGDLGYGYQTRKAV